MNSPTEAVEAEATGQRHVVATYKGHDFKIVRDPDDWPLDLVYNSVGIRAGKLVADHAVVVAALQRLLGDQWSTFLSAFPRRRDLVPASQALASAVGLPAEHYDLSFGALPRLLVTIAAHPGAVEETLANSGLDYRDRWRFDADGHRCLTLRRVYVALQHMAPNSPLAVSQNGGKMPLTATDLLLMDLFEVIAKTAHPSRPMSAEQKAQRSAPQDKVTKAADDWRQRQAAKASKTPRQAQREDAVSTAIANARIVRKAAASARSQ